MGNKQSIKKLNYEDIQVAISNSEQYVLINTLPPNEQDCLIFNTVNIKNEEKIINIHLNNTHKTCNIIVYGKNSNDESVYNKYNQLLLMGFNNVYVYLGGLFEWLLLQDIYGTINFPSTNEELDLLKFKPDNNFINKPLLKY